MACFEHNSVCGWVEVMCDRKELLSSSKNLKSLSELIQQYLAKSFNEGVTVLAEVAEIRLKFVDLLDDQIKRGFSV